MGNARASWWLKIERAEKHFEDFDKILREYRATDPYRISKRIESQGKRERWVHRLHVDQPTDETLPIIAGDHLFNVRSALDHIAVAHGPRKSKARRAIYFPVFADDIWQRDESTGEYLERFANDRTKWHRCVGGMSPEAQAVIKSVQPYNAGPAPNDVGVKSHSLVVLTNLQNADKHRELVVLTSGLKIDHIVMTHDDGRQERITMTNDRGPFVARKDGAEIHPPDGIDPATVKMEPHGTLQVMIGRANVGKTKEGLYGPMYVIPSVFRNPHFHWLLYSQGIVTARSRAVSRCAGTTIALHHPILGMERRAAVSHTPKRNTRVSFRQTGHDFAWSSNAVRASSSVGHHGECHPQRQTTCVPWTEPPIRVSRCSTVIRATSLAACPARSATASPPRTSDRCEGRANRW